MSRAGQDGSWAVASTRQMGGLLERVMFQEDVREVGSEPHRMFWNGVPGQDPLAQRPKWLPQARGWCWEMRSGPRGTMASGPDQGDQPPASGCDLEAEPTELLVEWMGCGRETGGCCQGVGLGSGKGWWLRGREGTAAQGKGRDGGGSGKGRDGGGFGEGLWAAVMSAQCQTC